MSGLGRHGLWLSHLLCAVVVLATSWPALENPRLEADDYRYLHNIQQVKAGNMAVIEAMTVENRWDHLWFMEEEGRIRFFRPTVLVSYAIDQAVWGTAYPLGLTLTNVMIHLACCMLVGFVLFRLLGAGWPALWSALLFAGWAAHAECIWYIAGRTDSLAALGFLAALALHLAGKPWWALPCFIFGLTTKELVVVAPVVFIVHDAWVEKRRIDWLLYIAYGAIAMAVLILKNLALGGEGSDFLPPYLVSPLSPGFPQHLWLQLRSYTGNLLAAEVTVPFADAETVALLHRPLFLAVGLSLLAAMGWLLRRDRRFGLLVLLGVLTWLPTSFVYLSERYLYLPSVALAGSIGLVLANQPLKRRLPLGVAMAAFVAFQAWALRARQAEIVNQPGSVQEMVRQLEPVRDAIRTSDHLLLVNLPGLFVRAQFVLDILRVELDNPDLAVDVLTMMPGQNGTEWHPGDPLPVMGAAVQVLPKGQHGLLLQGRALAPGQPPHRIQEYGLKQFNWSALDENEIHSTPSLQARIVSADPIGATGIEFEVPKPLGRHGILVWQADCSDLNAHPWARRKNATVRCMRLDG
ncbi:hypothetical protein [Pontiella desulfatans]|uniref:hypothetical protein n=1 Tax=Pontiella desulfatans TaxID=2750659 RepID=UPI00109CD567|nr:hypothetical protein [Pontiella desulfatans]